MLITRRSDFRLCCWQVVPIISIPGMGDRAAETLCIERKIASQHDAEKLKEAKDLLYLKGFNEGVLNVGPHKGRKVHTKNLQIYPLCHDTACRLCRHSMRHGMSQDCANACMPLHGATPHAESVMHAGQELACDLPGQA